MERNKPRLAITISPEIAEKLEKHKYNKSKLVDSLLTDYFKKLDEDVVKHKKN
jgi:hypothetical protein